MTEKRFWLLPMEFQDYYGEQRFVRDNGLIGEKSMSNQEVVYKLNEYELLISRINKLCNQNRIPNLLTTHIPVNCYFEKKCLDNHMINAGNMGKSNLAKEILQLIDGDKDD